MSLSTAARVLVIIPTLNRPEMCRRAIQSLIKQDFKDWFLVIAKNGWTDHLKRYMKTFNDILPLPNAVLSVLPQKGLAYALNQSAHAYIKDFDYFAVLEDDDEWNPSFLSTMVNFLDTTGFDVVNCLQTQKPTSKQQDGGPLNVSLIRLQNYINFPMCLFRSKLFEETDGFCEDAGPATDWDWQLQCIKAGAKYGFVPQRLVTHHWHDQNYCLLESNYEFIVRRIAEGAYGPAVKGLES